MGVTDPPKCMDVQVKPARNADDPRPGVRPAFCAPTWRQPLYTEESRGSRAWSRARHANEGELIPMPTPTQINSEDVTELKSSIQRIVERVLAQTSAATPR